VKNLVFLFYLIAGIIVGSLLAAICSTGFLSWLSFGVNIGFGDPNPAVLDLSVLRVAIGVSLKVTLAHVLTIGLAIWLYSRKGRRS